ncbi:MAG TPA: LytR C-terminal domain-containing protein [Actinomycetota bacterium]
MSASRGHRPALGRSRRHRSRSARIAERLLASGLLLLVAGGMVAGTVFATDEVPGRPASSGGPPVRSTLVLLEVKTDAGALIAVVGSSGTRPPEAVIVPATVFLTIPGQGDGSAGDAALLPGPQAAMAISNILGMWIPHYAFIDEERLSAVVDRAGGISLYGKTEDGAGVTAALGVKAGRQLTWEETLTGLFAAHLSWSKADLEETDDASAVAAALTATRGAEVEVLPTLPSASTLLRPDDEAIAELVSRVFGGSRRQPTGVIVLNGTGRPGVGESIAARLIPAGFRIEISQNASSFGHGKTLIVANSARLRPVAERIRRLMGVGSVSIAGVPSGLGDVTIVVGRDYLTG